MTMGSNSYRVNGEAFKKCPVCKKGKVLILNPRGLWRIFKSPKTECNFCKALFFAQGVTENEETYTLDLSESEFENQYDGETLKVSEWNRGISDVDFCIKHNKLPDMTIRGLKVILPPGEKTHNYSEASLFEERSERVYQSGHAGFRVMKGVYLGGSKGRSVSHPTLKEIDSGYLLLTNLRLIFNGSLKNMEYKLEKISSVEEGEDFIEVASSNRQKVQNYVVDEPHKWSEYLKIAIGLRHKRK